MENYPPLSIPLHPDLTSNIVKKIPEDVKRLLMHFGSGLCIAGGFCRDAFIGEEPKDIDIFAVSDELMREATLWFNVHTDSYQLEKDSLNSINFRPKHDFDPVYETLPPIQFVTRAHYHMHGELIQSFDWSICQIAVYWNTINEAWEGICTEKFGEDIQSGTLHYTAPERDEDPGASVLRMMRFTQRGWRPTEESIARCLGRFTSEVAGELIPFGTLQASEEDYTEKIKVCFRQVGYSGKKGQKSASFPLGD